MKPTLEDVYKFIFHLELFFGRMHQDYKDHYVRFLTEEWQSDPNFRPEVMSKLPGKIARERHYKGVPPIADILDAYHRLLSVQPRHVENMAYWKEMDGFNAVLRGEKEGVVFKIYKPTAPHKESHDWAGWGELPDDMRQAVDLEKQRLSESSLP